MYYLSLFNIVLKSNFKNIKFKKVDTLDYAKIELDINNKMVTIEYSEGNSYSQIEDYVILKNASMQDEIDIEEGTYLLHEPLDINGFKFALSDSSIGRDFTQLLFEKSELEESRVEKRSNSIRILLNEDIDTEEYIELINTSNYYYILEYEDPIISNVFSELSERTNRVSIRSENKLKIKDTSLLIETADYISALILTLMHDYPNVQFFNVDQDQDDSKYKEFCKYIANPESFDNSITSAHVFSDPIYGDVLRTNCYIQFEYFTADIIKFNKRRFDYMINRFISDHGIAYLPFPGTDRGIKFNVTWNRNEVATDQEAMCYKSTTKMDPERSSYSFTFSAKLIVTIYRLKGRYPQLSKNVLGNVNYKLPNTKEIEEEIGNNPERDGIVPYTSLNGKTYYR
jgi:hypothetical protein